MLKTILMACLASILFSCKSTQKSRISIPNLKIKPNATYIVRLTDPYFVLEEKSTISTMKLLTNYGNKVMEVEEFDSINYRHFLHLESNWEPNEASLRRLNRYVNYDYLLIGGWIELEDNFYFISPQSRDDYDHFRNEPEESIANFTYYLINLRSQQLELTITVRRTATGNSYSHPFFKQKAFRKAYRQLVRELKGKVSPSKNSSHKPQ